MKKYLIPAAILLLMSGGFAYAAAYPVGVGGTGQVNFPTQGLVIASGTTPFATISTSTLLSGYQKGTTTINDVEGPAFTFNVAGTNALSYSTSTGIVTLNLGGLYIVPFTASTTAWQSFYDTPSSRITAGTNMTWTGNQLDGKSDSSIRGLFSAGTGIQYNSSTGVITNGGVQSVSAGAGISVSSATGTPTIANTAPHVTSTISAGGGTATGNSFIFATSGPALSVLCGIGTCTFSLPTSTASQAGVLTGTDWTTFNNKQPAGNYITALTGDGTASGPGSAALTFATVNSNVGTFGSSSTIPAFTVNAKGLITAASNSGINAAALTGVVPYANGGTATSTAFTQGSVIFAGPDGLAQNNSSLFWSNTGAGRLGIGTSTPGTILHVAGDDAIFRIDDSTGAGNIGYYASINNNTQLSANRNPSTGIYANTNKASAAFNIVAANGDSGFQFFTSPTNNGTIAERMRIDKDGRVGIGTSTPAYALTVAGKIGVASSAPSVSSCGTTPSIAGNDSAGRATIGSGVVTSCTLTFTSQFARTPACVASDETNLLTVRPVATTSTLTLVAGSTFGGDTISYICMGL